MCNKKSILTNWLTSFILHAHIYIIVFNVYTPQRFVIRYKCYRYVISFAHALFSSLKGRDFLQIVNFSSKLDAECDKV